MKRFISPLIILALGLSLVLTGCGNSNNQVSKVQSGVKKLLTSTKSLKKAIDQGNDKQVKKIGPTLETEWSSFEDQVKPKYPDDYAEIEKYLDPAIAGTKVTPIDKKTLSPLVDNLIKAVQNLSTKVNK